MRAGKTQNFRYSVLISPQNIQKAKLLYRLTPFTAIKGILAITNPVNFLQDLANIFLTKPLNTKNLAQLMVSETASQVSLKNR